MKEETIAVMYTFYFEIHVYEFLIIPFCQSAMCTLLCLKHQLSNPNKFAFGFRRIENPRIVLLDCSLEYKKGESQVLSLIILILFHTIHGSIAFFPHNYEEPFHVTNTFCSVLVKLHVKSRHLGINPHWVCKCWYMYVC